MIAIDLKTKAILGIYFLLGSNSEREVLLTQLSTFTNTSCLTQQESILMFLLYVLVANLYFLLM